MYHARARAKQCALLECDKLGSYRYDLACVVSLHGNFPPLLFVSPMHAQLLIP